MASIQNTLRCPHCAVELEVNAGSAGSACAGWEGQPARLRQAHGKNP